MQSRLNQLRAQIENWERSNKAIELFLDSAAAAKTGGHAIDVKPTTERLLEYEALLAEQSAITARIAEIVRSLSATDSIAATSFKEHESKRRLA
ncbi:MAG: hypothetical protein ACXV5I_07155 [Halobacteriota archaeon]